MDWTDLLSQLPELTTLHGVRFFYEVSEASCPGANQTSTLLHQMQQQSHHHLQQQCQMQLNQNQLQTQVNEFGGGTGSGQLQAHPHPHTLQFTTSQSSISVSDRSRIKKNDEVASVLAWKCPKLRRVDHWEERSSGGCGSRNANTNQNNPNKVILLTRDGATGIGEDKVKVRWEVRRVKL